MKEIKTSYVAAHLQRYPNDVLGKGLSGCVSNAATATATIGNTTTVTEEVATVKKTVKQTQTETSEDLKLTVMGNPGRTMFTVKIESRYNQPVQIRIFDTYGRAVEAKANQLPNSTVQFGHHLGAGTYYAEFVQGSSRKLLQLMKVK